ncbi:MAG: helix-hairpin-helix domain-containing protein [Myxococcota bacterium]|nr:helix-hairpin-helix domain-containing protein [Myxococcota bacterium]
MRSLPVIGGEGRGWGYDQPLVSRLLLSLMIILVALSEPWSSTDPIWHVAMYFQEGGQKEEAAPRALCWLQEGERPPILITTLDLSRLHRALRGCALEHPLRVGEVARRSAVGATGCRVTTQPAPASRRLWLSIPLQIQDVTGKELEQIRGIGPARAASIVAARHAGQLPTPESLIRIRGIGPKTYQRVAPSLSWEPAAQLWPLRPKSVSSLVKAMMTP